MWHCLKKNDCQDFQRFPNPEIISSQSANRKRVTFLDVSSTEVDHKTRNIYSFCLFYTKTTWWMSWRCIMVHVTEDLHRCIWTLQRHVPLRRWLTTGTVWNFTGTRSGLRLLKLQQSHCLGIKCMNGLPAVQKCHLLKMQLLMWNNPLKMLTNVVVTISAITL